MRKFARMFPSILGFIEDRNKLHPVTPYGNKFDLDIPDCGISDKELKKKIYNVIEATPATGSKRFFNQLFGRCNTAAIAGDTIASALNVSMYTRKVGGIHIDIENILISEMCHAIGYGDGDGIFNPGGSISNLVAMVLARNDKIPEARNYGYNGRLTMYTSCDGHYSITKNAGIIGIGRRMVRHIAVDARGRMSIPHLLHAIKQDEANGHIPFMVNATAGTTVRAAFDPLLKITDICQQHHIWMHVDGAFGASLLLCDSARSLLEGVNLSDSVTWDAHKLMGVPLTCSALLLKEKGLLENSLNESADYLYQAGNESEHGMKSIQCGRRNDVLKLWCAWQSYGKRGYNLKFNKLRELIQYARDMVVQSEHLTLMCEPESLTLCFNANGSHPSDICSCLETSGKMLIGHGKVNGHSALRFVCLNEFLTKEDIKECFTEFGKMVLSGKNVILK